MRTTIDIDDDVLSAVKNYAEGSPAIELGPGEDTAGRRAEVSGCLLVRHNSVSDVYIILVIGHYIPNHS